MSARRDGRAFRTIRNVSAVLPKSLVPSWSHASCPFLSSLAVSGQLTEPISLHRQLSSLSSTTPSSEEGVAPPRPPEDIARFVPLIFPPIRLTSLTLFFVQNARATMRCFPAISASTQWQVVGLFSEPGSVPFLENGLH